ncbi:cell division protein [Tenacibaculum holothuriorum]|uniref:Cell division protein n=1 Tax=Tenacibaculum holothuriorum TaxID=1635173 RepID=A0A1Y2PBJ3_9FLAO|nr:AAA family ATPase [Tenacibaculum holothuriorum]OSY87844.1 cell division protein [Tenacibaculum holothuriorum]
MYNELIKDLIEALKLSPNNIPLRLRLGKCYEAIFDLENAEEQYLEVLRIDDKNESAQENLANVYYSLGKYDASLILIEELLKNTPSNLNIKLLELQCKVLIKLNEITTAQEVYKSIIAIRPDYINEDFDNVLKTKSITIDHEVNIIDSLLKKSKINFEDIGGMEKIKNEISLKIIQPLLHPELYKAYGKKIGGGILLYGPPGCGKTHIAKATAGEINANFISVSINDILDMWTGNSEKNLHEIFETARKNTPCVIFIDEIDALGANRNDMVKNSGRTLINQFLSELDGINSNNEGILILGATNTPWHLDPAFRRPGRFDRIIFVTPPDDNARKEIFEISLKGKPLENLNYKKLAQSSKGLSGADINAVIDIAIEEKLQDSLKTGQLEPLSMKNLLKAIKKHKPSTKEWFNSARNYALYSNDSGLYDDVLHYLNIKK